MRCVCVSMQMTSNVVHDEICSAWLQLTSKAWRTEELIITSGQGIRVWMYRRVRMFFLRNCISKVAYGRFLVISISTARGAISAIGHSRMHGVDLLAPASPLPVILYHTWHTWNTPPSFPIPVVGGRSFGGISPCSIYLQKMSPWQQRFFCPLPPLSHECLQSSPVDCINP